MYVEGHQPLEQLQDLAQALPQKRIWRRFQAVILAMQGRTAQDIARCLACSLRAVKNWVPSTTAAASRPSRSGRIPDARRDWLRTITPA